MAPGGSIRGSACRVWEDRPETSSSGGGIGMDKKAKTPKKPKQNKPKDGAKAK